MTRNSVRLGNATRTATQAGIVNDAAAIAEAERKAARLLPDQPQDCRRQETAGIAVGDRLDAALLKSDRALGRANARVLRCAGWYDDLKGGFADE